MIVRACSKYLYIIQIEVRRWLAFRWQLLAVIVGKILSVWLVKILWTAVYTNRSVVANFELKDILTYYVIIAALQPIATTRVDRQIGRGVQTGNISNELLRPIPLYWNLFVQNAGQAISRFFAESVPLLLVATLIIDIQAPTSLFYAGLFGLACLSAHLLAFNIGVLVGSLSFWVTGIEGPLHLKKFFFAALSGALIPLSFYPESVRRIIGWLPFRFLAHFPLDVYLGLSGKGVASSLGTACIWIALLSSAAAVVSKRGTRRVTFFGG